MIGYNFRAKSAEDTRKYLARFSPYQKIILVEVSGDGWVRLGIAWDDTRESHNENL